MENDVPLTKQKEMDKPKKKKNMTKAQLDNLVKGRAQLKEIFETNKTIKAAKAAKLLETNKPKYIKKKVEIESDNEISESEEEQPKIIIKKVKKPKKKPTIIEVEETDSEEEEPKKPEPKSQSSVKRHFKSQENTRNYHAPYIGNHYEGFI